MPVWKSWPNVEIPILCFSRRKIFVTESEFIISIFKSLPSLALLEIVIDWRLSDAITIPSGTYVVTTKVMDLFSFFKIVIVSEDKYYICLKNYLFHIKNYEHK